MFDLNTIIKRVELHLTLRCNAICANCDQMVGVWTPPDSDMTLNQIEKFIGQTQQRHERVKIPLERINVMGGEPLVHPQFVQIYQMLQEGLVNKGIVPANELLVRSNGIIRMPNEVPRQCRVISARHTKQHWNVYVSPKDKGYSSIGDCRGVGMPVECGIVVNAFGYFPCSTGGSLVRLFGMYDQIFYDFPDTLSAWDYERICPHCAPGCIEATREALPATSDYHSVPKSETFIRALENTDKIILKRL